MGGKKTVTIYRWYDCVENKKKSTGNLLELISEFRKVVEYKINIQKQLHFCMPVTNIQKMYKKDAYNSTKIWSTEE